ncbi:MAG: FHA domain-containing protein [Planctomycetota bacterium]|nr:FHA domain-containing protein [Planctomycetota bacterium]
MAEITLRVLDGSDRGKVHDELPTPVTIGREEGNSIQLNDERVSRFHLKIQADRDKVVLTDLQSTNGTKVNGEDIQLRILRYGDLITVGRSTLLYGSREQVQDRLRELRGEALNGDGTASPSDAGSQAASAEFELEDDWEHNAEVRNRLHALKPPILPESLTPGQSAQLCELLEYVHIHLRELMSTAKIKSPTDRVAIEYDHWQKLIDVQARLAEYLRAIGNPGETMT